MRTRRCPDGAPSSRRPRASRRRIASASMPIPAANPNRRPLTRPSEILRVSASDEAPRGADRIARQAERARQHVRAAAGDEADGRLGVDPVQDLVEAAVAREDVDRLGAAGIAGELGGVTAVLRVSDVVHVSARTRHGGHARLGDGACVRVDDEETHPVAQDGMESAVY